MKKLRNRLINIIEVLRHVSSGSFIVISEREGQVKVKGNMERAKFNKIIHTLATNP